MRYVDGFVLPVPKKHLEAYRDVHVDAIGVRAAGGSDPMRRDTIFRISSMSKPVTAAAAMILVEECKLRLDDPVDRLLPELANRPNEAIRMRLDFLKPFAGTSTVDFSFKPVGDQTAVTWSMVGRHTFLVKAIGLFMSMDKMIGGMFEQGLASLDSVAQAATRKQ